MEPAHVHRAPDDVKPMKVQLPVRQHIELHSLRVLTDRNISEIVRDAVARYLDLVKEDGAVDLDRLEGSDLGE